MYSTTIVLLIQSSERRRRLLLVTAASEINGHSSCFDVVSLCLTAGVKSRSTAAHDGIILLKDAQHDVVVLQNL
jgi:hypothetical protein